MLSADLVLSKIHSFAKLIDRLHSFYTYVKAGDTYRKASQISCTKRCLFAMGYLKVSFQARLLVHRC